MTTSSAGIRAAASATLRKYRPVLLLLGLSLGLWRLYRWAEPDPRLMDALRSGAVSNISIRLENVPFTGFSNGRAAWSVHAGQIDIERPTGGSAGSLQAASLTDITEGALYPPEDKSDWSQDLNPNISSKRHRPTPTVTFQAGKGRYSLYSFDPLPLDLTLSYSIQWQLRLSDHVVLTSKKGERLTTESLRVLDMVSKRSGKHERRILCDSGVAVTRKDTRLIANTARYDPDQSIVECLDGVTGLFPQGEVTTNRVFWSLREELLRCPDTASGRIRTMQFTADGLIIDLKHRKLNAARASLDLDAAGEGFTGSP